MTAPTPTPGLGELTVAVCEIPGHVPHAARITVDYGLQVTSFCLPPEHAAFLSDALASKKPLDGTARKLEIAMTALRQIDQDGDDYSARATAEEALADIAEVHLAELGGIWPDRGATEIAL